MRILALVDYEAIPGDDPAIEGRTEEIRASMECHVLGALRKLGHDVTVLPFGPDVTRTIDELTLAKPDLVFNMTERFEGDRRKDLNIAALLELLHLPYTGTGPSGLALCRDKATCKRVLGYHRVRVPRFALLPPGKTFLPRSFLFPMIVKPVYEDGSDGISLASIVRATPELEERVRMIHERMKQPAICEEYIDGREIYIGIVGNGRLQSFPPRELRFGKDEQGPQIATARVKWDDAYRKKWGIKYVDSELPEALGPHVARLSKRIFQLLQMNGYGRIDLRVTSTGEAAFLEANPNPDLSRDADLASAAARAGMDYETLIDRIVALAVKRGVGP